MAANERDRTLQLEVRFGEAAIDGVAAEQVLVASPRTLVVDTNERDHIADSSVGEGSSSSVPPANTNTARLWLGGRRDLRLGHGRAKRAPSACS
jgi:hypothetical protein